MSATLTIYDIRDQGNAIVLWPPDRRTSGLVQEARDYMFEWTGVSNASDVELYIDDIQLEGLRTNSPTKAKWRWSPGFNAGTVRISLTRIDASRIDIDFDTDPDIAKLTRQHFDQMVRDILDDTLALFSLSGFRTGISKGVGHVSPPIARLEFLRTRINELDQVIRDIDRAPVRILRTSKETLRSDKLRKVSSVDLCKAFSNQSLNPISTALPFADRCKGVFPKSVTVTGRTTSVDIGEHRAIKAQLRSWKSWLMAVSEQLASFRSADTEVVTAQQSWSRRCRKMANSLQALCQLPLFSDVSDVSEPFAITAIFRNNVPYQRFFKIFRDINLGIAQIQGDFLQMPLARTFELYELWVFLRLLRAAVVAFDVKEVDASSLFAAQPGGAVTIRRDSVSVAVNGHTSLCFKRSFREYWTSSSQPQTGSYSRTMIPDVCLTCPHSEPSRSSVLVIDAKYRIETQLNDAIGSLHMYRDAIVEDQGDDRPEKAVVAAYVFTPYVPKDFDSQPWKNTPMPSRLFHPVYRDTFKFGAVTFRPGITLDAAVDTLRAVIADAGIQARI